MAEQHDDWVEGRRYLRLDVLARSRIAVINTDDTTVEKDDLTPAALTAYGATTDDAVAPSSTTTADSTLLNGVFVV